MKILICQASITQLNFELINFSFSWVNYPTILYAYFYN